MKSWHLASWVTGAWLGLLVGAPAEAQAQTKVACAGEQTTHSLHRENDPEYPELMGKALDADFVVTSTAAPHGGGFLEGGGTDFTIGNFGHPQASVLSHELENPKTFLKSEEFTLLAAFKPKIVVLGPFGAHEVLAGVPLANFSADLETLLVALLAIDSKPLVAVATPLPLGGVDNSAPYAQFNTDSLAKAKEHKLPVIDLWTEFVGKTTLFQDGTHLTLAGRQHLADFVAAELKDLVKELESPPDPAGGAAGVAGAAGAAAVAGSPSAGSGGSPIASGGAPSAQGGSAPSASGSVGIPSGGSAGGGAPASSASADSGCGCRMVAAPHGAPWGVLLLGALLVRRRRRH